jgi:transposase
MVKIKEYSQDIRDAVAKHCEQGKGAKKIIEYLGGQVPNATVYRWIFEFKSSGMN